jgi:urease accessory protein
MHVFTRHTKHGRPVLTLVLPFERRRQARLRTTTTNGEEVGLVLERGTVLKDGDLLASNDGVILRVVAAEEPLSEASIDDPLALARVAWHLGNRHALVEITAGRVRFARDAVLAQMVQGLGCTVREVSAPFHPEAGAYAAANHSHAAVARTGIIHDFSPRD